MTLQQTESERKITPYGDVEYWKIRPGVWKAKCLVCLNCYIQGSSRGAVVRMVENHGCVGE